jgi:hypothetical protein
MRFRLPRAARYGQQKPALSRADSDWIVAARRSFFDYSVGSNVPDVFEGYARILHPAWAPADRPVRWDAVARWSGRRIHALAQWEFLSRPTGPAAPGRPFVQDPSTGGLPPVQLGTLYALLATHTSTPDQCFIGIWEGYGWLDMADRPATSELRLDQRTFLVRQGPIEDVRRVGWRHPGGTFVPEPPTIVWPADRAWFVAGDTDLDSTYVGGSAALISMVIAEPGLEAWSVGATDRVSIDSDLINGP